MSFKIGARNRAQANVRAAWKIAIGDQAKCRLSSKTVSPLATRAVITENIFWHDARKTRFVPTLYIGNLFGWVVVE